MLNKTVIGGDGGWDYVTLDPQGRRLFVTRTTHTLVLDAASLKVLADIPGQKSAHGVALAPGSHRGFISDGADAGSITIFDLNTYAVLGKIAALPDADGIIYDPATNLVLVSAGDSQALLAFPANLALHGTLGAPIKLGGKPEFLAADGHGRAFINLEDKNLVAVVDLKSRKVIARWPTAPGGHPVGLSLDATAHRLFIGCRNPQKLVVMNSDTGKVEATTPIGAGVDATAFAHGEAFASCHDGRLFVASGKNGSFKTTQTLQTAPGARTMTIDPENERIYLPTADLESNPSARPRPKPGTFTIVVVGRR